MMVEDGITLPMTFDTSCDKKLRRGFRAQLNCMHRNKLQQAIILSNLRVNPVQTLDHVLCCNS